MKYTTVIGLEIHAELLTKSKIFCGCENSFGGEENQRVCPVCLGLPGTLPVLNREAVTLAVLAGLALNCSINAYSAFNRKNYFYPDLPKAYQITQFEHPICGAGKVGNFGITRIHLEEDAGKLVHDDGQSRIDYNRCGVPLIEIVTEPDFRTAEEVCRFVEEVCLRLRYAGVCDARLEQGSLRVDVNISRMPTESKTFGTRAEIKNLNSLRSIRRAIAFEEQRQTEILEAGGKVLQETRRFCEETGKTVSMRTKEEAHDYRYFPEPDIPPVMISQPEINQIQKMLPQMPEERRARYREYGLSEEQITLLVADREFSDYYDAVTAEYPQYKQAANWMNGELNRNLHAMEISLQDLPTTPQQLAELIQLCEEGKISRNAAKTVLKIMCKTGESPMQIAQKEKLFPQNNTEKIRELVQTILKTETQAVNEYHAGNPKIMGFLMGQVMRAGGSGLDPAMCRQCLLEQLEK